MLVPSCWNVLSACARLWYHIGIVYMEYLFFVVSYIRTMSYIFNIPGIPGT